MPKVEIHYKPMNIFLTIFMVMITIFFYGIAFGFVPNTADSAIENLVFQPIVSLTFALVFTFFLVIAFVGRFSIKAAFTLTDQGLFWQNSIGLQKKNFTWKEITGIGLETTQVSRTTLSYVVIHFDTHKSTGNAEVDAIVNAKNKQVKLMISQLDWPEQSVLDELKKYWEKYK